MFWRPAPWLGCFKQQGCTSKAAAAWQGTRNVCNCCSYLFLSRQLGPPVLGMCSHSICSPCPPSSVSRSGLKLAWPSGVSASLLDDCLPVRKAAAPGPDTETTACTPSLAWRSDARTTVAIATRMPPMAGTSWRATGCAHRNCKHRGKHERRRRSSDPSGLLAHAAKPPWALVNSHKKPGSAKGETFVSS